MRISVVIELRDKMVQGLKNPAGREVYKHRGETAEPVFGQVKHNRHLDRLYLHGINGAKAEVMLGFLAHNLLKCARWGFAGALLTYLERLSAALTMILAAINYIFFSRDKMTLAVAGY